MNKTKRERIEICENCSMLNTKLRTCSVCGCFVDLKAAVPFLHCPRKKW